MFSSIFQLSYLTEHCHNVFFIIIVKIKVFKLYRGPVRVNHEIIHSAMTIYTYFYGLHTLPLIESANCNKNICPYLYISFFGTTILSYTDNNDYFHQTGGQQSQKISLIHFCLSHQWNLMFFMPFWRWTFSTTSSEVDMSVVIVLHIVLVNYVQLKTMESKHIPTTYFYSTEFPFKMFILKLSPFFVLVQPQKFKLLSLPKIVILEKPLCS